MKNKILKSILLILVFALKIQAQQGSDKPIKVAVFLYQGVELLDFAGPLEVFSNTRDFEVYTVAPNIEDIMAMNKNIKFIPNYSIQNCPQPDIVVFPGANMEALMAIYTNDEVIDWIKSIHQKTQITMSVCTGAAFLSKAGILDGHTVTTHWGAIDNLKAITPKAKVVANKRFVEDGKLLTTAGVSAGLDGALYVVAKLRGKLAAQQVAETIEYDKYDDNAGLVVNKAITKTKIKTNPKVVNTPKAEKIIPKQSFIDPICGMDMGNGSNIVATHLKKSIHFCSESCKNRFLKNPEKYTSK